MPWSKSTTLYYAQTLAAIAKHYDFSLNTKWNKLSKKIKDIILDMDITFATYPIKNALFTGGFFECYVYLLVKNMDYDDIKIGVKISRKYKK